MEILRDSDNKKKYWDGPKNKAIRYWFYNQKGLNVFNEFKYSIMFIFATYYTLKLQNPILIPIMFFILMPILNVVGYIYVHHVGKVVEFLTVQFSTHFSRLSYDLQEKQNKLLEEIKERLT